MTRFEVWKRKMNRKPQPQTGLTLADISKSLKNQIEDAIERHKNDPPSATQVVLSRSDSFIR